MIQTIANLNEVRIQVLAKKKHGAPLVPVNPESLQKIFKTIVIAVAVPFETTIELQIDNRNPRYRTFVAGSRSKVGKIVDFILKTEMNDCPKVNCDSQFCLLVAGEKVFTQSFRQTCPTTASRRTKNGDLPLELLLRKSQSSENTATPVWTSELRPIEEQIPTSFFLDISFNTTSSVAAISALASLTSSPVLNSHQTSVRMEDSPRESFSGSSPSSSSSSNSDSEQFSPIYQYHQQQQQQHHHHQQQQPQINSGAFSSHSQQYPSPLHLTPPLLSQQNQSFHQHSLRRHLSSFDSLIGASSPSSSSPSPSLSAMNSPSSSSSSSSCFPSPFIMPLPAASSSSSLPFAHSSFSASSSPRSHPVSSPPLSTSPNSSFSSGTSMAGASSSSSSSSKKPNNLNSFMVNSAHSQGPRSILGSSGDNYPFSTWTTSSGRFSI